MKTYRNKVCHLDLEYLESAIASRPQASETATKISPLETLHMIRKSWDSVTQSAIRNTVSKKEGSQREKKKLMNPC